MANAVARPGWQCRQSRPNARGRWPGKLPGWRCLPSFRQKPADCGGSTQAQRVALPPFPRNTGDALASMQENISIEMPGPNASATPHPFGASGSSMYRASTSMIAAEDVLPNSAKPAMTSGANPALSRTRSATRTAPEAHRDGSARTSHYSGIGRVLPGVLLPHQRRSRQSPTRLRARMVETSLVRRNPRTSAEHRTRNEELSTTSTPSSLGLPLCRRTAPRRRRKSAPT